MPSLAHRLKRLRKGKGLTQQELATLIGVGQSTVGNWESGTRDIPRGDSLLKLAEVLGVNPIELVGAATSSANHSSEDLQLLAAFRSLVPERKALAIKLLKALK